MIRLLVVMLMLLPIIFISKVAISADDSFRVLRQQIEGYASVVPGKRFVFPDDHGIHPDFRIEWWYLTANLKDNKGRDWGLQWTLFRQSMDADPVLKGWESNQLWMAHAAITTPNGHLHEQRFARGGINQAGITVATRDDIKQQQNKNFSAWIDDWSWSANASNPFPSVLSFAIGETELSVSLSSVTPWVLNVKRAIAKSQGRVRQATIIVSLILMLRGLYFMKVSQLH